MITTSGAGYSMSGSLAVTRWRADTTRDNWGSFVYVRDVRSGSVWSTGYQPVCSKPNTYEVAFSEDKADFWRRDDSIVTHLEVIVSGEDNCELRGVSITNYSTRPREIELTSYAEIVLASPSSDLAHPAFSNLFVETEFYGPQQALLAQRRPRSAEDEPVWGVHVMAASTENIAGIQYETDRSRFLGRGHTTADPVAVIEDRPLSNTVGAVLDPIFSLRCRVRLQPNQTVQIVFTTGLADSREKAVMLAEKYRDANIFERESRLAWTSAQVEMNHLHINPEEAHLFQRLAGRVLYPDPSLRPRPHVLALNKLTQSGLWPHGISGDLPIVILRLEREEDVAMARQLLRPSVLDEGLRSGLFLSGLRRTGKTTFLINDLIPALEEAGACGVRTGFSVAGDGGVAIDDKVSMREDGARVKLHLALSDGAGRGSERKEDRDGESESARKRVSAYDRRENRLLEKEAAKS